ncbi:MAG: SUMF1/EgtB/PvdO family nonheme iron enzyme, partial [Xanthomonadales bacterium]|nr:SUMF1/EgtB/PvdO family nonheme iron enzyme [Xanthomonadales bacterium]
HPLPPAARRTRWLALVVAAILLIAGYAGIAYWREQARSEQRLMIAELIENGQLDGPAEPNALAALAALNGDLDESTQQLRDRLLEPLWDGLEPALMKRDWVALSTPLRRWSDAVTTLEAHSRGLVVAQREQLTQQLRPSMAQALQRFDRAGADALLILLDDWQPLPPQLSDLVTRLRQIPAMGEALPDDAGPPLLLIHPPESDRPGLAIMAAALDPQWYGRFLADTGKTERECASPDPKVRGCVSLGEARQLADWLSQQSGQRYRLPTREEITEAAGFIAPSPTLAWTDSCQQVTHTTRPNAAKRAWGGIKQVFGGQGAKPIVERRCDGNWLMQLDGSGQLVARNNPSPAATVVLLREIPTAGDRPERP